MYIRTSPFVSLETSLHFIACIQQGFVDQKMQHTGAQQVTTLTSSRTSRSVLGFKELELTTHLCLI